MSDRPIHELARRGAAHERQARMLSAFYDCVRALVDQANGIDRPWVHASTLAHLLDDFAPYRVNESEDSDD
jgi:hypothetical protein